jgi:hypothetical protein
MKALRRPFDVRVSRGEDRISALLAASRPTDDSGVNRYKIVGAKVAIDLDKLKVALSNVDVDERRRRKTMWIKTYHEAMMAVTEPHGLKFGDMLLILARQNIIVMEEAFE